MIRAFALVVLILVTHSFTFTHAISSSLKHQPLLERSHILKRSHQGKSKINSTAVNRASSTTDKPVVVPGNAAVQEARAPGVKNALGLGQDPGPLTIHALNGSTVYLFPDINFAKDVYIRSSTDLNKVQTTKPDTVHSYNSAIGTEAPDLVKWDINTYLLTVSSTSDNSMRSLVCQNNPLETDCWDDVGQITNNGGGALQGFDSHVLVYPNGHRYLLYSDHVAVRIARMTNYTNVEDDRQLIQTYAKQGKGLVALPFQMPGAQIYNTEAPSSVILPNKNNGSFTVNVAFATGDFGSSNYNTRYMYIDSHLNPLDRGNWQLSNAPLVQTNAQKGVYGPGSGGFFQGPNGKPWFAYSGWDRKQGIGNAAEGYPRLIRAQEAPYDDHGILIPFEPVGTERDTANFRS